MSSAGRGERYASGLQHERTALAWNRTALTAAGLGALLVRVAARDDSLLDSVAAAVCLLAAVLIRGGAGARRRTIAVIVAQTASVLAGLAALVVLLARL